VIINGAGAVVDGVTNSGAVQLPGGTAIYLTGDLTNNDSVLVDTTGANTTTQIRFDASCALTGSGVVTLNGFGHTFNVADINLQTFTATHGANHTIHGFGTIIGFGGGILINNGLINGDNSSGNAMQVDLGNTANQNNSTMEATNGGALGLFSGSVDQTGGGKFL